jgi:hypothetical protein
MLAFGAIALATFACFVPTLSNTLYVWDNAGYILENENIRTLSLETVLGAFTSYWCNYWAPLTWLSLALDYALWGLNPVGYHLTNIVLHALNSGLFFVLAWELMQVHAARERAKGSSGTGFERLAFWIAVLAALLFGLHPLRVESVAWAAERKDVLSLLFGIPAVIAYVRHAKSRVLPPFEDHQPGSFASSGWYWTAFAFFCLSLLGKPMLVTLPAVLLILDAFPLERFRRGTVASLLAEKVPFLLASIVVTLIAAQAQAPQRMSFAQANVSSRILNAIKSTASYLWFTVWPVDISPFYVHPGNIIRVDIVYIWSALALGALTLGAVLARRRPVFLAAWLAYLAALVPVLGFIQVGPQAMAARFTYFPSLPIALVTAVVIVVAIARSPWRWLSVLLTSLTVVWLAGLSYCTIHHIGFWKDDVTLWTRAIDLAPRASGRAYFQRGLGYSRIGQPLLALADMNEALAIAASKNYRPGEIYVERAKLFVTTGRLQEAIADYSSALELAGQHDRAGLLLQRGELYLRLGEEKLAADDFRTANSGH